MAVHKFLLLLLVANSKALWDSNFGVRSWSHGRARAFECPGPGLYCESCTNSVLCSGAGATPLNFPCNAGQVCGGLIPSSSGCLEYAGNEAGNCDCDTVGNSGFLVDPYDPAKYFFCIPPEAQYFLSCPEGEIFSTEDNMCMQVPTVPPSTIDCSTTGIGVYTNDPTCQTYTACYSETLPGLPLTCPADEAFDSSLNRCVPKCDLAPPTVSCPAGAAGAIPDTSDCTIFHVCSNGAAVTPAGGLSCPDGQVFESMSMACVASSTDVVCPAVNTCWAAHCDACGGTCPSSSNNPADKEISSPTTTSTSTISTATSTTTAAAPGPDVTDCNNSPGYFEYPADCKKFYACQSDGAGGYESVLYRCPGTLVFIPSMSYCSFQRDLPAAPGCITS